MSNQTFASLQKNPPEIITLPGVKIDRNLKFDSHKPVKTNVK